VNDELERMRNEAAVAYFKVMSQYMSGESREDGYPAGWSFSVSRSNLGPPGCEAVPFNWSSHDAVFVCLFVVRVIVPVLSLQHLHGVGA
jgi:hypothetical protein